MFYQTAVANTLFFAVVRLGSHTKVIDSYRLSELVKASPLVGKRLDILEAEDERLMEVKFRTILGNVTYLSEMSCGRWGVTVSSSPGAF